MIRVSATQKKTREEILSELMWLDDLKQFKQTVCEPHVSLHGNLLEEFEIDGKTYRASMFRTARGVFKARTEMTPMFFICCGDLLGAIHHVSTDERIKGFKFMRKSKADDFAALKERVREKIPEHILSRINKIEQQVAELSQEIFDQVYGEGVVKSEEEFRAKVKESLEAQFAPDSDYKFLIDVREYLTNKIGKLEFPDALLKRIMLMNNEEKGEEFVNENYDKSIEELTWHLIKEDLVSKNEIKIDNDDVMNMAKGATRAQFAQYGMMNVPEDMLENYAKEMLKKKESVDGLVNRAIEAKLAVALKEQITLDEKTISLDEFNKLFQ